MHVSYVLRIIAPIPVHASDSHGSATESERPRTPLLFGSNLQSLIRRVICIAFAWGSLARNLVGLQKLHEITVYYLVL